MSDPKIMKTCCSGCPYDHGAEATEQAYNWGCLPSVHEIQQKSKETGKAWACHSAPSCVCKGYMAENGLTDEQRSKELLQLSDVGY